MSKYIFQCIKFFYKFDISSIILKRYFHMKEHHVSLSFCFLTQNAARACGHCNFGILLNK